MYILTEIPKLDKSQFHYNADPVAAPPQHSNCIVTRWQKSRNWSILETEISQKCPLLGNITIKTSMAPGMPTRSEILMVIQGGPTR
jgi:hypothetical protein